jgi:UDP-N-acetylmuramate: L-alanyl-gamma-D-glutamyl-meso-diaminopimelate ligase
MDMRKNRIPKGVQRIHLIAICGTAMGALACMLKDLGYSVTGSDRRVYPPMSHFLVQHGIEVMNGFHKTNLCDAPDLVVVGNAVTKDNPEVLAAAEMGLHFCSMPQALNRFVAAGKKILLVTGTHGKTTTSALLAWLLAEAGYDPTFVIGGILKNFDSNYHLGKGEYIIIEGDEYDTAFFDKGPKFMHYPPAVTILTSVEFDHADIFRDLDHVITIFDNFLAGISGRGMLIAFDGDHNVVNLLNHRACQIERYGIDLDSDWRLAEILIDAPWTSFEVFKHNHWFGRFRTRLFGNHNLYNALAGIAVADRLMIPVELIARGMETFQGIKRRQEIRGQKRQIMVMDDFAHHPTAVRETIGAVRAQYSDRRLVAVFEPRTNSSMRKVFQSVYPRAFEMADLICIRRPPLLEKIPVGDRFSSEKLVDDLRNRQKDAYFFPTTGAIIDFLAEAARPGDIILIMSNGGFDNIHDRLLDRL